MLFISLLFNGQVYCNANALLGCSRFWIMYYCVITASFQISLLVSKLLSSSDDDTAYSSSLLDIVEKVMGRPWPQGWRPMEQISSGVATISRRHAETWFRTLCGTIDIRQECRQKDKERQWLDGGGTKQEKLASPRGGVCPKLEILAYCWQWMHVSQYL